MANDTQVWERAVERLPLTALMQALGDGVYTQKKSECPFCHAKGGKWAVFHKDGRELFKCHSPGCVAENPDGGHWEVPYLALRRNLSLQDAKLEYLRMAVPELVPHLFEQPRQKSSSQQTPPVVKRDERETMPHKNLWHLFWQRTSLSAKDHATLMKDRGFSPEIIREFGLRSNTPNNRDILLSLQDDADLDELLAEGLWKEDRNGIRPQGQYCGWGPTDEKDEKGNVVFEVVERPLIPYLDEDGIPFYVRPHKGNPGKLHDPLAAEELYEDEQDEEDAETCAAHVFCPYSLAKMLDINNGVLILTEGEFKAIALYQCGFAAIACPGITFIANAAFRRELVAMLRKWRVREMIILFDNEDKGNPAFVKRYKADPRRRWDTVKYAEYVVRALRKDYFFRRDGGCLIGKLPDEWMVDGKADCDGILAKCVADHGLSAGTKAAREVFKKAIKQAQEEPGLELWPNECRRIVESQLTMLLTPPQLASGGYKEAALARRFEEWDDEMQSQVDSRLGRLYRSLAGCYYVRKAPPKERRGPLAKQLQVLDARIAEGKERIKRLGFNRNEEDQKEYKKLQKRLRLDHAYRAAIWEERKGLPEPISNFTAHCLYKMHRPDGGVDRLIQIRYTLEKGKTPSSELLYRITPNDLKHHTEFLGWCYNTGRANWSGGAKELQNFVAEMDRQSFQNDIYELVRWGYDEASKVWFLSDAAWDRTGARVLPDKNGIFWVEGSGYRIDDGKETDGNSGLAQGAPQLLSPHGPLTDQKPPAVKDLLWSIMFDMYETIGDYDGFQAVGMFLGYAIGPELVKMGGHGGLWLFGPLSGGKTTVARWLMKLWGFKDLNGIRIDKTTTDTALNRFLAQYANLPVWFDEYRRHTVDAQKESVIRGAFDRSAGAKGRADHTNRTKNAAIFTTPLVSGESSSGDAATRSRYSHVSVNQHRRIGDGTLRYNRVQQECKWYFLIGQWLMDNRPKFAEAAITILKEWMENAEVKKAISNERVRLVYGTAYSALMAAINMLGINQVTPELSHVQGEVERANNVSACMEAFHKYLRDQGEIALHDVQETRWLNQFWRDVLTALNSGELKAEYFFARYVKADPFTKVLKEVNASDPEARQVLYFIPGPVAAWYEREMARRHDKAPLNIDDLRRELEKEPYWFPLPTPKEKSGARVHRVQRNGQKHSCWVLSLHHREESDTGEPKNFEWAFAEEFLQWIENVEARKKMSSD